MAVCNTSLPWKHFRRAIKFTACQSGHKTRDQSLIAGNGYASLYSVPVRPYGTSRRKSILGEAEGRPTIKRVPIQRGGRSNERQGLRRNSSAQRCQIHTGATQKPTPQEHASLIAKVRRSLSEKHLVEAPQAQELRMCTVLAESPQNTDLHSLIDQLPEFHIDRVSGCPLLIFLVTPSFAAQAANDNGSIFSRIMAKASGDLPSDYETLIAVVDRLPKPPAAPFEENSSNAFWRARTHSLEDYGYEGLAFASTTTPATTLESQPTSAPSQDMGTQPLLSSHNKHASLTFNVHAYSQKVFDTLSQVSHRTQIKNEISSSVQIPLARTVFSTGLPHTLLHGAWSQNSQQTYDHLWTRNQDHFTATLPVIASFGTGDLGAGTVSLSLPLIALTNSKPVVRCMGNIIRQLGLKWPHVDDKLAIPASTELEKAVSEYLKARSIPPQSVSVWALVSPKNMFPQTEMFEHLTSEENGQEVRANWAASHPRTVANIDPLARYRFMYGGIKLRRVMSGGGGWGKKAGLLSLDPDSSYDPQPEIVVSSDDTPGFMDAQNLSPVGEVAEEGDLIQFFIFPYGVDLKPRVKSAYLADDLGSSFEFGVIPSTVDSVPDNNEPDTETTPEHFCFLYKNHFGALSEGGMAVGHTRLYTQRAPYDYIEEISHTSKVDVPFARFSHLDMDHEDADPLGHEATTLGTNVEGTGPVEESVAPLNFKPTEPLRSDRHIGAERASDSVADFAETPTAITGSDSEQGLSASWRGLSGKAAKAKYREIVEAKKKLLEMWRVVKSQKQEGRLGTGQREYMNYASLTSQNPLERQYIAIALNMRKYYGGFGGFAESEVEAFDQPMSSLAVLRDLVAEEQYGRRLESTRPSRLVRAKLARLRQYGLSTTPTIRKVELKGPASKAGQAAIEKHIAEKQDEERAPVVAASAFDEPPIQYHRMADRVWTDKKMAARKAPTVGTDSITRKERKQRYLEALQKLRRAHNTRPDDEGGFVVRQDRLELRAREEDDWWEEEQRARLKNSVLGFMNPNADRQQEDLAAGQTTRHDDGDFLVPQVRSEPRARKEDDWWEEEQRARLKTSGLRSMNQKAIRQQEDPASGQKAPLDDDGDFLVPQDRSEPRARARKKDDWWEEEQRARLKNSVLGFLNRNTERQQEDSAVGQKTRLDDDGGFLVPQDRPEPRARARKEDDWWEEEQRARLKNSV